MKKFILLGIVLLAAPLATAQNYHIDWWVIGSGGGHSESGNYQLDGTIGQPITGSASSSNYTIESGFWVGAPIGGPTCDYVVGDANNNSVFNGIDVSYSVGYFKGGPPPPYICECTPGSSWYVSGDVNGNCAFNGIDVSYMVSYFKGGSAPLPCPDCPPGGMLAPPPAPAVVPKMNPSLKTIEEVNAVISVK